MCLFMTYGQSFLFCIMHAYSLYLIHDMKIIKLVVLAQPAVMKSLPESSYKDLKVNTPLKGACND